MAFKLVPGGHAKGLVGGAAALTSCMVKAVEDVKALAVRANRRPPSPRVRHMQNKLSYSPRCPGNTATCRNLATNVSILFKKSKQKRQCYIVLQCVVSVCLDRSLDLGDVQFRESAAEFEEQDPLVQPLRLSTMDKGTQQFVVSLRQLTGWGPQVCVDVNACVHTVCVLRERNLTRAQTSSRTQHQSSGLQPPKPLPARPGCMTFFEFTPSGACSLLALAAPSGLALCQVVPLGSILPNCTCAGCPCIRLLMRRCGRPCSHEHAHIPQLGDGDCIQEPVGMGASTTPLPQAGGRAPHPARVQEPLFVLAQKLSEELSEVLPEARVQNLSGELFEVLSGSGVQKLSEELPETFSMEEGCCLNWTAHLCRGSVGQACLNGFCLLCAYEPCLMPISPA
eukprot:1161897-Pelagomonas_calceolata.AAC.2